MKQVIKLNEIVNNLSFLKEGIGYKVINTLIDECLFATAKLNLEGVPIIEEKDFYEQIPCKWIKWSKQTPSHNGSVWLQFNGKNQGRGRVFQGKLISLENDKVSNEFWENYKDTFYWLQQNFNYNTEAQQNLFTEEQVRDAMDKVYGWMIPSSGNGTVNNIRPSNLEDLKTLFIQSLKQPKVEIQFDEEGKPIKCILC